MEIEKRNFTQDEWVKYILWPNNEALRTEKRALILEVLENDPHYHYKILIDNTGVVKKVRESKLFPAE
jgi:hypothetical protein